jgi:transposase-like protein
MSQVKMKPADMSDIEKAKVCEGCPVCKKARRDQKGIAYLFVRFLEGGVCPYCQAYERVNGRKAHARVG